MNYKYIKKKSKKQEDRTAKEFGGKTTCASGAMYHSKGDVKTKDYLIENKYTDSDKYKLEVNTWLKIEKEALKESLRVPMLQVDIQDESYVIMDRNDLLELAQDFGAKLNYSGGVFVYEANSTTLHLKELKARIHNYEDSFNLIFMKNLKPICDLVIARKDFVLELVN